MYKTGLLLRRRVSLLQLPHLNGVSRGRSSDTSSSFVISIISNNSNISAQMANQAVVDAEVPMSCHGYFASVNNSRGRGTNEVLTVDSTTASK